MPKVQRYAGFAEELTYGEDPAPAADFHVDKASSTLDAPSDTELVYEGGLHRGDKTHRPGFYSPSGNVVYGADIRTIGWFLKWALGGYTYTLDGGAGTLDLHEIYADEEKLLPSFCTRLGKDVQEHGFSGCVVNSLQIQIEDGFSMLTLDTLAQKDFKAALVELENLLLPAEYPLSFPDLSVTRAAADITTAVKTLTLEITNNPSAEAGRSAGSRFPRRIPAAARAVTAQLGLWFEDWGEVERFWGAVNGPSDDGSTEFASIITLDAGADGKADFSIERGIWTQAQQQPSGRDEIVQQVNLKAFVEPHTLADTVTAVDTEMLVSVENNEAEMVATT